jgi:hypothetical protein
MDGPSDPAFKSFTAPNSVPYQLHGFLMLDRFFRILVENAFVAFLHNLPLRSLALDLPAGGKGVGEPEKIILVNIVGDRSSIQYPAERQPRFAQKGLPLSVAPAKHLPTRESEVPQKKSRR